MPNAGHADEPEEIDVAFANAPAPGLRRFWSLMPRVLGSFLSATKVHVVVGPRLTAHLAEHAATGSGA